MQVSVQEAQENLSVLLDRVESGEDILLTKDGVTVARIVRSAPQLSREERRAILDRVRAMAPMFPPEEPTADRSHDDLYDEDGLPV